MLNKLRFGLVIAIGLCVGGCATTSNNQALLDEAPQSSSHRQVRGVYPFQGEQLVFDVRHVATKASLAGATVQVGYETAMPDGTRYIPIVGHAESKSIIRLVARIDDRAEAYIDPDTWETIYSYKHLHENDRNREYNVWFWNEDASVSAERHSGDFTNKRDYAMPPGTMDSIAWVYEIRTMDLQSNKKYVWYTFDGWTLNRIVIKVLGMEDVWTENGFYHCRKFEIWRERSDTIQPRGALSGVFIEPARNVQVESYKLASAWIGDDDMHTPVRLVVDTAVGSFDILLKSVGKLER